MSNVKRKKLNYFLLNYPKGAVVLPSWFKSNGYSLDLVKRYKESGWIESIGKGAYIRSGDSVDYLGALYAMQQSGLNVHIGGRSALSMMGKSHYLELNTSKVVLFSTADNNRLPMWFNNYDWEVGLELHSSSFLPADLGLVDSQVKEFNVKISSEVRALMECLYLAPKYQELQECYELMEGMNNLVPQKVQELLECCQSIKVKRLFLFLADHVGHEWLKYLDLSKIDLGQGKRQIFKNGTLDQKFWITVPSSWSKR